MDSRTRAEQMQVSLAEKGDVHEGPGSGQHREQPQQQHLVQRVDDPTDLAFAPNVTPFFARLPWIELPL
jgi:hypothetical protein